MKHFTTPKFWKVYDALPEGVKKIADRNYELLKANPFHPSLHFKKVGSYWSVRVGLKYRALGIHSNVRQINHILSIQFTRSSSSATLRLTQWKLVRAHQTRRLRKHRRRY